QSQRRNSRHGFADRAGLKARLSPNRRRAVGFANTITSSAYDLVVLQDGDADPWHAIPSQTSGHISVTPFRGRNVTVGGLPDFHFVPHSMPSPPAVAPTPRAVRPPASSGPPAGSGTTPASARRGKTTL